MFKTYIDFNKNFSVEQENDGWIYKDQAGKTILGLTDIQSNILLSGGPEAEKLFEEIYHACNESK
jgi:hypothetical protein